MIRTIFAVIAVLILWGGTVSAKDPCIDCHIKETPGIVAYWKNSAHFGADIKCAGCHGGDIEASHSGQARVEAERCGNCHKDEYYTHRLSKHAISLKSGRGCTRNMTESEAKKKSCGLCHEPGSAEPVVNTECAMFLAQSPAMQRQGCGACHRVETGCDSCHTKHGTDREIAGTAEACGTCHMGPDHAQYEMWRTSPHGVIFQNQGDEDAPTCITCHMNGGSHNVSRGIATGKIGDDRRDERDFMLSICSKCHTRLFSNRNLSDADKIEKQSRVMLGEASEIIKELNIEGLLEPAPEARPEHPIFGHELVVGPHMLYEDLSRSETIFFRMMMFYYMSAFKGAFHQNPDYSHWFGNAKLKLSLSELKSEAALLKKIKRVEGLFIDDGQEAGPARELKKRLRELEAMKLKGEITKEEYKESRETIFKEMGF